MAGEWPKTWSHARLGDVADVNWGDTSVTKASYLECGFPAYSATGPDGFLPYADYDRTGVILSAIGAECGRTWLARGKWSCIKNTIRFWSIRQDVDTEFLYWLTRDPSIWPKRGSAQPFISQGDARNLVVAYPPLTEQRAIAHILGTLDDKIELNRRMNVTLEAMARAIFKSWFVDFDPVRAKAEGRQPFGMDAQTAALFPASFQDSPLGKIPKGWKVRPLPEAVQINPPRPLAKKHEATYLEMQNMPTRGHRPVGWIRRPFVSGSRFTNGDTLIARITPCLENGKTALVDFLKDGEVGWGSTEFIVLRPMDPLPPEYGYCLARDEEFREFAIQNMTGSSGRQRVPTGCFAQYLVAVPPEPIARHFGKAVRPLFGKVRADSEEAATLADTRDALLPKLVSGEFRIKDAERIVMQTL